MFEADLIRNIERLGFLVLPIGPEVMLRAARFEHSHADPFDRIIAAHAIHLDLPVMSIDPAMDGFVVRRVKQTEV